LLGKILKEELLIIISSMILADVAFDFDFDAQ